MMISQWCSIDKNRFCQEKECQGCHIFYSHILALSKTWVNPSKDLTLVNSGSVLAKSLGISRAQQPV